MLASCLERQHCTDHAYTQEVYPTLGTAFIGRPAPGCADRSPGRLHRPAAEDDLVLEIKQVRDSSGVACLQRRSSEHGSNFWDGTTYWVHAWVNNYAETDVGETFQAPGELEEVVYDIGVQLGRGHAKDIVAPHEFQLRRALTVWLDDHEDDIREAIAEMTSETLSAWRQFKVETSDGG